MMTRAKELLEAFDPSGHPLVSLIFSGECENE
jgi:hypothetical protein